MFGGEDVAGVGAGADLFKLKASLFAHLATRTLLDRLAEL